VTTIWPLTLPYTKPPLSLNDRGQTPGARARRSEVAARLKSDTAHLARAANIGPQQAIHVRLHYRPPDRIRRDADNLVATLKPCIDGLVVAGVVPDDSPAFVDWSAPRIHEPTEDRKPLLWLTVTAAEGEA
jgi:crossover junction endodeoxyribonuclease RusA